jgi:hypothetical protein
MSTACSDAIFGSAWQRRNTLQRSAYSALEVWLDHFNGARKNKKVIKNSRPLLKGDQTTQ